MKIYVVTHKPVSIDKYNLDSCYNLIRVGSYSKEESYLISDSTGDNISEKNPNYCELTAQYWIWKNDKESDITGLCHYRRYFTKRPISTSSKFFLNENDIREILRNNDAIVARDESFKIGAYEVYLNCGYEKDLAMTKEAISKLCPEYLPYYESAFENSASFRIGNMMIARKEIFDAYSEWLFKILGYVEEHISLEGYTVQEARVYGYLSERLLNVWLKANNIKCKSMRFVNTEENHTFIYYLKEFLKMIGIYDGIKTVLFKFYKKNK